MFLIIFTLLVLVVFMSEGRSSRDNARNLSQRFCSLGDMYGKSKSDIIQAVGAPSAVSSFGDTQLLQWQRPGYHVALRFDADGMFAGIQHEFAYRR